MLRALALEYFLWPRLLGLLGAGITHLEETLQDGGSLPTVGAGWGTCPSSGTKGWSSPSLLVVGVRRVTVLCALGGSCENTGIALLRHSAHVCVHGLWATTKALSKSPV